jgi:hypothetical protein
LMNFRSISCPTDIFHKDLINFSDRMVAGDYPLVINLKGLSAQ